MAVDVAEVERALLALPPHERAAVIHSGLLSLDDERADVSQEDIDAAWRDEFRRRIDDIETGRVDLVSHHETVALALARLEARRA